MQTTARDAKEASRKQQALPDSPSIQKKVVLARQKALDTAIVENDRAEEKYQKQQVELRKHLWKAQVNNPAPRSSIDTDEPRWGIVPERPSVKVNQRAITIERDIGTLNKKRLDEVCYKPTIVEYMLTAYIVVGLLWRSGRVEQFREVGNAQYQDQGIG